MAFLGLFSYFTSEKTRKWWGEKLSVMLNRCVEGFWNDMMSLQSGKVCAGYG